MNDWDRDNLNFIMNVTGEDFDLWLEQADDDDIQYAIELIRMAKLEIRTQEMLCEMELTDDVQDISQAAHLIERIKNG
jgi:hypothetical protein